MSNSIFSTPASSITAIKATASKSSGSNNNSKLENSLESLQKSFIFINNLPADPITPPTFSTSITTSSTSSLHQTPRLVKNSAFSYTMPEPVPDPQLLCISNKVLKDILTLEEFENLPEIEKKNCLDILSGNKIAENTRPWSHCYGGHQFGYYAGQLGDGRAISLFEFINNNNEKWELQLKGKTPYSRMGDGYAVLRSSIREFLASEALAALGVPTSRALSLVHTPKRKVIRESIETGAIVCRLAPSWIRFGSFEIFYHRKEKKELLQLAEFVCEHLYNINSEGDGNNDKYGNKFGRLFNEVSKRTALMVAKWQAIGFCHGVMNTDNMSILGLTIDYGPYGFLDVYNPGWICNHSDYEGRYSFKNQPVTCLWNLLQLGITFQELIGLGNAIDSEEIIDLILGEFQENFLKEYENLMCKKLGFNTMESDDLDNIITPLLNLLSAHSIDYHHFFYSLSSFSILNFSSSVSGDGSLPENIIKTLLTQKTQKEVNSKEKEMILKDFQGWFLESYLKRLIKENQNFDESLERNRIMAMKQTNPKFVLRNWVLDEVIKRVERNNDVGVDVLKRVLKMCQEPFNETWCSDDDSVNNEEILKEEARFCGIVPEAIGIVGDKQKNKLGGSVESANDFEH
ncbi:9277_t:CDS:10 [Entrophospora sp. SA101]|nr:9277_t:CDS:10 [Entrophospora sp. SA101]